MLYKTHATFGLVATLGSAAAMQIVPQMPVWVYALAGLAALLPDVDHPEAYLNSRFGILMLPFKILSFGTGHRGASHSLVGWLAWGGLSALLIWLLFDVALALEFPFFLWLGLWIGYLSHILIDMTNPEGVRLLWPFHLGWYYFPPFFRPTTGSFWERLFILPFLLLTFFILIALNAKDLSHSATNNHVLQDFVGALWEKIRLLLNPE